jgi:hypothetical protein
VDRRVGVVHHDIHGFELTADGLFTV